MCAVVEQAHQHKQCLVETYPTKPVKGPASLVGSAQAEPALNSWCHVHVLQGHGTPREL